MFLDDIKKINIIHKSNGSHQEEESLPNIGESQAITLPSDHEGNIKSSLSHIEENLSSTQKKDENTYENNKEENETSFEVETKDLQKLNGFNYEENYFDEETIDLSSTSFKQDHNYFKPFYDEFSI